jgi:hypothetical protein
VDWLLAIVLLVMLRVPLALKTPPPCPLPAPVNWLGSAPTAEFSTMVLLTMLTVPLNTFATPPPAPVLQQLLDAPRATLRASRLWPTLTVPAPELPMPPPSVASLSVTAQDWTFTVPVPELRTPPPETPPSALPLLMVMPASVTAPAVVTLKMRKPAARGSRLTVSLSAPGPEMETLVLRSGSAVLRSMVQRPAPQPGSDVGMLI